MLGILWSPASWTQTNNDDPVAGPDQQKWLLEKLEINHTGMQPDGSAVVCIENKQLKEAMLDGIGQIQRLLARDKNQISYDIRILRATEDQLSVCVLGRVNPRLSIQDGALVELPASTKLYVNKQKDHYRIWKSRKAGERDLRELCRTSEIEENFVFITYQNKKTLWVELGVKEAKETASIDLLVLDKVVGLQSPVAAISFYHHHPEERIGYKDHSQTPSGKDLEGFVKVIAYLKDRHARLLKRLDFRVVTSIGVYIFRPHKSLADNQQAQVRIINIAGNIEDARAASNEYLVNNQAQFAKSNRRFAKRFSSRWMRIAFRAWPTVKFATTKATKTGIYIRDSQGVRYTVYYNRDLNRLILLHPVLPVLYNERGERIGYASAQGQFIFGTPPKGWQSDQKSKIKLEIYDEIEEKLMNIKLVVP